MKKLFVCLVVLVGMLACAQQAWAVILDFNMDAIHPAGVTIYYDGGATSTALNGSNISVDTVVNLGGIPLMRSLSGGRLNFTTGAFTGSDLVAWYFAPGGSVTLTGGVDLIPGGSLEIPAGTTLLSGSFVGAPLVVSAGGTFKVVVATFADVKDPQLAAFYGLNDYGLGYTGTINLSFNASGTPGSTFTSTSVLSGDVTNQPKVPEPTSMALLGLGLVGFLGSIRKKFIA